MARRRLERLQEVAGPAGAAVEAVPGAFDLDTPRPVAARWRDTPRRRPTAVYAYNDDFALLLIKALAEVCLSVPRDTRAAMRPVLAIRESA